MWPLSGEGPADSQAAWMWEPGLDHATSNRRSGIIMPPFLSKTLPLRLLCVILLLVSHKEGNPPRLVYVNMMAASENTICSNSVSSTDIEPKGGAVVAESHPQHSF